MKTLRHLFNRLNLFILLAVTGLILFFGPPARAAGSGGVSHEDTKARRGPAGAGSFKFSVSSVQSEGDGTLLAQVAAPAALKVPAGSSWWALAVPIVVPILVRFLKGLVPSVPRPLLPLVAAGLGLAFAGLDYATGCFGGNPQLVAMLGLAGTGVREVMDQAKQALAYPPEGGTPNL